MRCARVLAMVATLSVAALLTGCLSGNGKTSNGGGGGNGGNGGNQGNASLKSISLQPQGPTVAPGDSKQFTATGHYSDGSTKNITSSCSWSSSDKSIATVDATTGLAQAIASGSSTITASFSGVADATTLTVAKLSNVTVAPGTASINPGGTQQFTATAHYANGEAKDVTTQATWSTSDVTIATIDQSTGLADGIKSGKVTITASFPSFQGDQGTASLTVLGIVSITVTTQQGTIGPAIITSGTQQFKAVATYNDNSQKDVTSLSTWNSTVPAVATIVSSPGGQNNGLATAVAVGQTEIQATYQKVTGATAMDVTASPAPFTNASLSAGDYVISLTNTDSRGVNFLVGTIHSDGNGNITSGTVDTNTALGVFPAQPVQGKYTVFPDGRGDMSFAPSLSGAASHVLRFVLSNSSSSAQVIEFDSLTVGQGKIEQQSQACSSFGATDIQGSYTLGEGGITPAPQSTPLAAVGSFTASGSTISGQRDVDDNGTLTPTTTFTGSYTQDATTACRYVVTLNEGTNTFKFAYYAVSPGSSSGKAYFAEIDASPSPVLGGVAEQQTSTTIANGSYVFLTSFSGTEGQFQSGGIAGQIGFSGTTVTGGEEDEAPVKSNAQPATITGGTLTAGGTGRYVLSETTSTGVNPTFVLYTVSATRFFMLRSDPEATNVAMGAGDAQTSVAAGSGPFTLRAASLGDSPARADLGLLFTTQSCGAVCGVGDRNLGKAPSSLTLVDSSALSADGMGRGSFTLTEPAGSTTYFFYVITPNKFVVLGESLDSDGYVNAQ